MELAPCEDRITVEAGGLRLSLPPWPSTRAGTEFQLLSVLRAAPAALERSGRARPRLRAEGSAVTVVDDVLEVAPFTVTAIVRHTKIVIANPVPFT